MANGDITVTTVVTGSTTGGSQLKGFTNSKIYSSINDVIEREITVPTSEVILATVPAGAVSGYGLAALNHFEFKNLDATNFIQLGFVATGSSEAAFVKVKPGEHFIWNVGAAGIEAVASATFVAFTGILNITAKADTASCKCSYVAF